MNIEHANPSIMTAVVLNWRSPVDTVRTVQQIRFCGPKSMNIIIIDNASCDSSVEIIKQALCCSNQSITCLNSNFKKKIEVISESEQIFLIQSEFNLGYAGGNNIGIEAAMQQFQSKYILIVNNDARPTYDAIQKLIATMESKPNAAFCTGILVYPGDDKRIQCVGGGCYYPFFGRSRLLGNGKRLEDIDKIDTDKLDYLMGACLLVRTDALIDFGLMDEDYFLYAEEMDWQRRAKKASWNLIVCKDAIIEHGDSVSTKGSGRSHLFYYYINRAAVLYNIKWYGILFSLISAPFVIIGAIYQAKNFMNIFYALKGIVHGYLGVTGIYRSQS